MVGGRGGGVVGVGVGFEMNEVEERRIHWRRRLAMNGSVDGVDHFLLVASTKVGHK